MAGRAKLNDCALYGNIANLTGQALHASGGGAAVAEGATLELRGARMHSNSAGGEALIEATGIYATQSQHYLEIRAAYIDCAGTIAVVQSTFSFAPPTSAAERQRALANSATALIIGRSSPGAVVLRDSSFESAVNGGTCLLRLVDTSSQSLVRGCSVENMTVDVNIAIGLAVQFAAVNSSFQPPLNLSDAAAVLRPPQCSEKVAGEKVCDPRARCESRPGGGVQCTCIGDGGETGGLRNRPGEYPDGRQCEQVDEVDLQLQSKTVVIKARKPGDYKEKLLLSLRAEGELKFNASFSLQLIHSAPRRCGDCAWSMLADARSMATRQLQGLNGYFLTWPVPPANNSLIDLDGNAARYAVTRQFDLQVRLDAADCGNATQCVADGDTIVAVMRIGAPTDESRMRSEVRLVTEVEAYVSCERSSASIVGNISRISVESSLRVRVLAIDVNGVNVSWTRAAVRVSFNNQTASEKWSPGSNEYVSEITDQLTRKPGRYELLVTVLDAWSEASSQVTRSCVLLNTTVLVECSNGANTVDCAASASLQYIILGVIIGASFIGASVLVAYHIRANKERAKLLLVSFLKHEGVLVFKICWEAWVSQPPSHCVCHCMTRQWCMRAGYWRGW